MSRKDTKTPASFPSETRPALPQSRASIYLQSLHKTEPSASAPSESDWVSPFTLPPLPAFQRTRGEQSGLKSPEQHKRSNSSLFYAAAWGSPYATPSPHQSPASGRAARKSLDSTPVRPSPYRLGSDWIQSLSLRGVSVAQHLYSPEKPAVLASVATVQRIRSQSPERNRSERENWLSDSEGSDIEAKEDNSIKTPTRTLFSTLTAGSFGKPTGHRVRESIVTITPENFNAPTSPGQELKALSTTELSSMAALGEMHERYSGINGSPGKEKPLPLLPRRQSSITKIDGFMASPTSPNRPRLGSSQSFSRPKKQVLWKGKKCIIALPLQDREEAGLPLPLSPTDVNERLRRWEVQGFDTNGFVLGDSIDGDSYRGSGHSRSVYPNPIDVSQERQQRKFHISIPNQAEWDAWVDYLKEEKLRALGVTSSNSEAPPSTRSPFSANLSRSSSHYRGLTVSPPMAPSSAASNQVRLGSNPFSPPFNPSTGVSSQSASIASPSQYAALPGAMHRYKQSTVQPAMQSRMISPFDPTGQGFGSPLSYFAQRQANVSPAAHGSLPNLGEIFSPISPFPAEVGGNASQQNLLLEQMRRQQHALQAHMQQQQQQHQHQHILLNHPSQRQSLSSTPVMHPKLEIAHPTPQSHRHNLSGALQKKIDEGQHDPHEGNAANPSVGPETRPEDEEDDSLPILKRPDGFRDNEDIITNPSNEPSPIPRGEVDPLANWKPLKNVHRLASEADTGRGHKVQPSMSKLNVQAKVFDPRGAFTSSNFSFGGSSFQAFRSDISKSPTFGFGGGLPPVKPTGAALGSVPHLNVEAPAFTPSFQSKPPPQANTFKFSAASFNVEAPEFNPLASLTERPQAGIESGSEGSTQAPSRIFGDVVINSSSKATRRTKALPVVRPRSKDGPQSEQDQENQIVEENSAEDENGRPEAPVERLKRTRRGGSDGDESPVFADSAPFNHRKILSEIVDDAQATREDNRSNTPPTEEWHDGAAQPSEVEEEKSEDKSDRASSPINPWSSVASMNEKTTVDSEAVEAERQAPQETPESQKAAGEPNTPQNQETVQEPAQIGEKDFERKESQADRKPKISLSALAKPFEYQTSAPEQPVQDIQQAASKPRKSLGLLASRFARSPSPPSEPSSPLLGLSSPPSELYSYIKPEDGIADLDADGSEISNAEAFAARALRKDLDEIVVEEEHSLEDTNDESDKMSVSVKCDHTSFDRAEDAVPSYEEIDAVMKQFEQNPDLGVERLATPPVQSTPMTEMHLPPNIRSDAPSPSPRRVHQTGSRRQDSTEIDLRSPQRPHSLSVGVHKLTDGTEGVSDWNDTMSPVQEDKLQHRAQFFDGHVNDLVGGILENRLGPLEKTLKTIQHSLALMSTMPKGREPRRSISIDIKDSDADDEDEYDAFEGFADYRARSPMTLKSRGPDAIKMAVMEAMSAYKPAVQQSAPVDMSEVHAALAEMRQLAAQAVPQTNQADLKAVVEEVIGTHPRLRGQRVQQGHDGEDKYKLQIDGLETMLKVANERAEEEAKARRLTEDDLADIRRRLRHAEEDAAQHRESSEEVEKTFSALLKEKEAYRDLEETVSVLSEKNAALESTLDEYRESHKSWQNEIRDVKDDLRDEQMKSQDLERTLHTVREQLHERSRSREALRATVDRLRGEMASLVHNVASERSEWREVEHELTIKHKIAKMELDREHKMRAEAEQDLEEVEKTNKENLQYRLRSARAEEEVERLVQLVARLQVESKVHQDSAFKFERELSHAKESNESEISKATTQLQIDLERANSHLVNAQTDAEAQIARLQGRVDNAELDLEEQKAKHENLLAETVDAHSQALQEATEKREAALQEQHATHERKLADLRDRHTRALHNSSDDRHRLEHHLNEKLALSDDKAQHLEGKVQDLEDRLAITKSAARAAVEAATTKGINLPTPAPSTVASPPSRPSLSFATGSDIPEKISPQALRESIMVLQDQLQNREQAIEKLESELAAVDKDAPKKIQNLETEIGWLRELLTVRVDDIEDLINVLSEPDFDRNSAKDAAIRLKANLQMEQQLKERALISGLGGGLPSSISLPSIASLSSTLTQSPRALPMAAAAAWGNWRKARDSSIGALSDLASNLGSQTPSRSTVGSPASFLSGMMTPPGTSSKSLPPSDFGEAPTRSVSRPLTGLGPRKGSGEARPLRAYNSQPRALSKRKEEVERPGGSMQHRHPEVMEPVTPTLKGRGSPNENQDDRSSMGFGEDVDEDASPLEGKESSGFGGLIE